MMRMTGGELGARGSGMWQETLGNWTGRGCLAVDLSV